ncbi:MAG: methyltransferase domain-containing protein [Actinomycetota bacterium]|nr:methyltransferase domain-containing protein [Actinomycetota bacterium]
MADAGTGAAALRARMVADLEERGELPSAWRRAFWEVERHAFIPPLIWRRVPGVEPNDLLPLHRAANPEAWLELAYANAPVDTLVDDGRVAADGTGHEVSSSASMPTIVAEMLDALDAQPGMRVLEIGTGTGYNAALLAHRLGGHNVSSVEIDPRVADRARTALEVTGYDSITVITGDGAEGFPPAAPYDRIIATAGVCTVPYAWIAQTVPGGRIVLPLSGVYQPPGILTLTVHADGTATGRFGRSAAFMALRSQRVARPRARQIVGDRWIASTTDLHPYQVAGDHDAAVAIGLRVRDCHNGYSTRPPGPGHPSRARPSRPTTSAKAAHASSGTRCATRTNAGSIPDTRLPRHGLSPSTSTDNTSSSADTRRHVPPYVLVIGEAEGGC